LVVAVDIRRVIMRRFHVLLSLMVVVLLGVLTLQAQSAAIAQEATPPAEELEGVTFEPLGFGTAEELPAAPAVLQLFRVTLDPGASIPAEEGSPNIVLLYVESGSLTIQIESPLQVTRAATIEAFATPGAVEEGADLGPEEVAAGTEVTLEAGDSVVLQFLGAGELRNDGDEPVVGLGALVAVGTTPPA
jgi:quercetin dioxygenase-like cupin family protein